MKRKGGGNNHRLSFYLYMRMFAIKEKGFTLIEIMVVVGIISLLATLAIPQMLRARMNANELGAISALRTIGNGSQAYYNNVSPHTYPASLADLTFPISNPVYIGTNLANAVDASHSKQGYYFTYTQTDSEHFSVIAWPVVFGRTGSRNFFTSELGTITYNKQNGLAPTANDPPA